MKDLEPTSEQPEAQGQPSSSPGFGFYRVIERASSNVLEKLLGQSIVELISQLEDGPIGEMRLRGLAKNLLDPREVLQSKDLRGLVTDSLPIEKARELAANIGVSGSGNVYDRLKQAPSGEAINRFFGADSDTRRKSILHPVTSTVDSSYGLYAHQRDIALRALSRAE